MGRFHVQSPYPLDVFTLGLTRPHTGRQPHHSLDQSQFLLDVVNAVRHGAVSSRLYADRTGISIAAASWRFRVARDKGLISPVAHPGTHAGGIIYGLAKDRVL